MEFKGSEIRIGNLILNDGQYCIVDRYIIKNSNMPTIWEHYEPITLTEKHLLLLGLKKEEFQAVDTFSINKLIIDYRIQNDVFQEYFTKCQLKYVHQVQNLYFALYEEELIINKDILQI